MYIKTQYHTIRPYGSNTKPARRPGLIHQATLIVYDETGFVIGNEHVSHNTVTQLEETARHLAEHNYPKMESWVLVSIQN
jgi:hypothetical protein